MRLDLAWEVGPLLFLLIVAGIVFRITTPEERAQFARDVQALVRTARKTANRFFPEDEAFRDTLRARTPRALVTAALVGANVAIFVFMLFGSRSLADPSTLIAWGGSFGPRTTNGEWWRLLTATFVHLGTVQLLVNMIGLAQIGLLLERLLGHVAFAAVYAAAGMLSHVVRLSAHPMAVTTGASGAIVGLQGLLLALLISQLLRRSTMNVPLRALWRLAPATALCCLYRLAIGFEAGDAVGFVVGLASGIVLVRGTSERKPSARRLAVAVGATMAIAVLTVSATAFPLDGITDVRPEIERVVAVEERTSTAYDLAVGRFTKGRMTAEQLVRLIEETIAPDLEAARSRVEALVHVPDEHQPLVAGAEEYLQLRDDSWRLRVEGLNHASISTLREADSKERAALNALEKIKPVGQE